MSNDQSFSRAVILESSKATAQEAADALTEELRGDAGARLKGTAEQYQATLATITSHVLLSVSTPPVVVRPSRALVERIDHSNIEDIPVSEIPLPFWGYVVDLGTIQMPEVKGAPGFSNRQMPVRVGICAHVNDAGVRELWRPNSLICCLYIWTVGPYQSQWIPLAFHIPGSASTSDMAEMVASRNGGNWSELLSVSMRRALGVSLYLTTEKAEVAIGNKPLRTREGTIILPPIRSKQGMRARQQERRAIKQRIVVAGKSLPPLKAHANTIVRGHFRRQPYGPGRSLRKTIWIQPHVRFKDESFPTLGREIEAQEPTR